MNKNIGSVNWKNLVGALISAVIAGLAAILFYLSANYMSIAWFQNHPIVSAGILAGIASILKAFGTNFVNGKFVNVVPVQ